MGSSADLARVSLASANDHRLIPSWVDLIRKAYLGQFEPHGNEMSCYRAQGLTIELTKLAGASGLSKRRRGVFTRHWHLRDHVVLTHCKTKRVPS